MSLNPSSRWSRSPVRFVLAALAYATVVFETWYVVRFSPAGDAHAYWAAASAHPYVQSIASTHDAYLYSPAFLQILAPLRALPFDWFWAIWVIGSVLILLWLVGPVLTVLGLFPTDWSPIFIGVWYGNIHLPMTALLALALRFPGLWSFMLLTKVTPGLGLLWFAARREWSKLGIALGVTALVVAISVALAPGAWLEWVGVLSRNASGPQVHEVIPLPPLAIRLLIASALIVIGAMRNEARVLPLAMIVAMPIFWFSSLTFLLAWRWQSRHRLDGSGPMALDPSGQPHPRGQ